MPQQPETTSSSQVASPATAAGSAAGTVPVSLTAQQPPKPELELEKSEPEPAKHAPQRIPRWLERVELFLRVMLRMYIGLAVCIAPWWHMFWDQNPLFVQFPALSNYAANGAVRGIVSGLGLLNLWIAFNEVVRRRDG